jgi:hypothetical protein
MDVDAEGAIRRQDDRTRITVISAGLTCKRYFHPLPVCQTAIHMRFFSGMQYNRADKLIFIR